MKTTLFFLCASALLMLASSSPTAADEITVPIGLLPALSGPFSQLGLECRDGYELARKWRAPQNRIGRYRLNFIYGDSRGEGKTAAAEFQRFLLEKPWAVLSAGSYAAMPINAASAHAGIPHLGVLGHRDFLRGNPYAFQFWPSSELEGRKLAHYAAQKGLRRVTAFTAASEYPQSMLDSFRDELISKTSGEIINHEVELNDLDFRPLLLRTRKDPADAIFVNLGLQQIGIMLRQIRELNINTPRLSNFWAYGRTNFDTAGAPALDGLVFVVPSLDKPKFNELAGRFQLAEATAPVYTCFASMAAILEVFEKDTNLDGPAAVHQALKQQSQVTLPDEQLSVENRLALFPLALMVFRGGKPQLYGE